MKIHGGFQGAWQIVRFNPWFYTAALGLSVAGAWLRPWMWVSGFWGWAVLVGYALAAWWTLASLVVSHWVYDRSDWRRGDWLRGLEGLRSMRRLLNVHAGFDETTERLRAWLSDAEIESLSLFDPARLTERSIHRAAAYRPSPPGEWKGSPEAWPVPVGGYDAVLFLLSAHEFRRHEERAGLLRRARESLAAQPGSLVVLAEHARDTANFIAFGPGLWHFHSTGAWRAAWEEAGFEMTEALRVTPFLRVWVLRPVLS